VKRREIADKLGLRPASRREEVAFTLGRQKVLPVITSNLDLRSHIVKMAEALISAGVQVLEITATTPYAHELIAALARQFPHLIAGAGTIQSLAQAERFADAGARFLVSHRAFAPGVAEMCLRRDMAPVPAGMTPTELELAFRLGNEGLDVESADSRETADLVKFFPASEIGGPGFVRAVRRPCSHIPIMPSGGVGIGDISSYLKAGAAAVNVAGALYNDRDFGGSLASGDWSQLRKRAQEALDSARPRIWSFGECMIEILVEGEGDIPESFLARYIASIDDRSGPKSGWKGGSLCREVDELLSRRGHAVEAGEETMVEDGDFRVFIRLAGDAYDILPPAAELGSRAIFLSAVGDCPSSRFMLNWFRREGVDASHVALLPDRHLGAHFLVRGKKRYSRWGSAASLMLASMAGADFRPGDVLHITGISQMISHSARETAQELATVAHEAGAKISYDVNDRPDLRESPEELRSAFEEIAPKVSFLFVGLGEARDIFGLDISASATRDELDNAAAFFFARCPEAESVVLTLAHSGAGVAVKDAEGVHLEEIAADLVKPQDIVEPVGAGDAFAGAFLHAVARGFPPIQAAQVGSVAAQMNTLFHGAIAPQDHILIKQALAKRFGWGKAELVRL
jgi:2-dehydro-3-deoxyphosphogluconate aldolase/(4S)-4-hydroxy-2-oxoglutarate aldolase